MRGAGWRLCYIPSCAAIFGGGEASVLSVIVCERDRADKELERQTGRAKVLKETDKTVGEGGRRRLNVAQKKRQKDEDGERVISMSISD